ncbi:hypothetical protein C8Q76DRAFT_318622 [Earliella scabrosa]|nr:hypothetical protein C8Q76DRAFT_318622 [Earliella scabrosa]
MLRCHRYLTLDSGGLRESSTSQPVSAPIFDTGRRLRRLVNHPSDHCVRTGPDLRPHRAPKNPRPTPQPETRDPKSENPDVLRVLGPPHTRLGANDASKPINAQPRQWTRSQPNLPQCRMSDIRGRVRVHAEPWRGQSATGVWHTVKNAGGGPTRLAVRRRSGGQRASASSTDFSLHVVEQRMCMKVSGLWCDAKANTGYQTTSKALRLWLLSFV